jgi:hypothetical protein
MAQSHVVLCRPGKFSGKEKLNFFAGVSDLPRHSSLTATVSGDEIFGPGSFHEHEGLKSALASPRTGLHKDRESIQNNSLSFMRFGSIAKSHKCRFSPGI